MKHSSYVVIASPSCRVILLCLIHMNEEKVACSQNFNGAAGQGGYTYNTVLALHLDCARSATHCATYRANH